MAAPPQVDSDGSDFPSDPIARAEFELELFGQHLFFLRNRRMASISRLVNDQEKRDKLGTIHRKAYDAVGKLDEPGRDAAVSLAQKAIDLYMQDILELLSHIGSDFRVGQDRAIRYQLLMEIIDRNLNVLWNDTINRDSAKYLPDYFGRWLNKYKGWGAE